jgi:dihydroflavonol-4-reductase
MTTATKRRAAIEKRQRAVTLITGGTGFLGSHLVRQLTEEGAKDIRVMATSIPDWLVDLGVETFAGSITNAEDNKRAVEGISQIYHLAGKVSREREDARAMYDIHVEGTRLLCDAAKAAGVKTIVLASTSGTIAVTEDGEAVPDETYPVPHHLALALLRQQGLPGDGGTRTLSGQRSASCDHEPQPAAWSGRRSSQFH